MNDELCILFSYRVSRQDSTKHSPFLLVYGRQPRLPIEFDTKSDENCIEDSETEEKQSVGSEESVLQVNINKPTCFDDYNNLLQRMVDVRRKALENIQSAQERQKKYYDTKHCKDKEQYKVGAAVLLLNSKKLSRRGSKLEQNWMGPYHIHEVLPKGTYRLCNPENGNVLAQKINMTRLKLYYKPKG